MSEMMAAVRSSVAATAATKTVWSISGRSRGSRSSSLLFTTARSSSSSSSTTNDDDSPSPSPSSLSPSPPALFRIYYNDVYKVDLPPKHRFPMWKYERVRKRIQSSLLLRRQNQIQHDYDSFSISISSRDDHDDDRESDYESDYDFHVSPLATKGQLETTHCPEYIQRFLNGQMTDQENRNVGFPWSKQGVDRATSSVGGTVAAATYVCDQLRSLRNQSRPSSLSSSSSLTNPPISEAQRRSTPSWAAHVAGGTHHAFYDRGEGFSVFSDIGVAANVVLKEYPDVVRNILIVDLDVHQGNGNAKLFETNPNVFTFSIHCDANYFSKKEFGDLDIELPAGCTDPTYLMTLNHWLNRFKHAHVNALQQEKEEKEEEYKKTTISTSGDNIDKNNKRDISSDSFKIDLIFFQAGVDILDDDRLGRMDISSFGLRRRNEMVYQFAHDIGVPVVITMGGGYPKHEEKWEKLIDAHSCVYIQAYEFLKEKRQKKKRNETNLKVK